MQVITLCGSKSMTFTLVVSTTRVLSRMSITGLNLVSPDRLARFGMSFGTPLKACPYFVVASRIVRCIAMVWLDRATLPFRPLNVCYGTSGGPLTVTPCRRQVALVTTNAPRLTCRLLA